MLTKFYLHISDNDYELRDDDLMNWGGVKCSLKREGYGGVVRSFTSQFEFVNHAKELLQSLYLQERFDAKASLSVWTQNNAWGYDKRFECELDFSTISWEGQVLRINAVDNSLSALIKANKGTKYEFVVGEDINADAVVGFDRIPMKENVTYEFTQGVSSEDSADIRVTFTRDVRPWVGNVGSEVAINRTIHYNDDQEDNDNGYMLRADTAVTVTFEYDLEWRTRYRTATGLQNGGATTLGLMIKRDGSYVSLENNGNFTEIYNLRLYNLGTFSSESELPSTDDPIYIGTDTTIDYRYQAYAIVHDEVYIMRYNGRGYIWENTGKTADIYYRDSAQGKMTLNLQEGDILIMKHTLGEPNVDGYVNIDFIKSKFIFSWMGIGEPIDIDAFSPRRVLRRLLTAMTDDRVDVLPEISAHDTRLAGTYLMAAESIRGLQGAKLYTSFNEFCDWMSAVFGYVYLIEKQATLGFSMVCECGRYTGTPYSYVQGGFYSKVPSTDNIYYNAPLAGFYVLDPDTYKFYPRWPDSDNYNDASGHARTDVLFRIKEYSDALCCFNQYSGGALYPTITEYSASDIGKTFERVRFLHRSELFSAAATQRAIDGVKNLKYSVDSGSIYSSVTAGYDKKDYNSINGRDEFNFSNEYTTGCSVSDRKLTLLSKYRADSYGIEFAAQKRQKDTTDSSSDKDVFFMLCARQGLKLIPDRSMQILNSISDKLFNGAFSPMACIRANKGFIGLQSDDMTLAYASSTGNSDIAINGEPMTADIAIDDPIATCGMIEFDSDAPFCDGGDNDIIKVSADGVSYKGFLKESDTAYARAQTTTYKLIVKDIQS